MSTQQIPAAPPAVHASRPTHLAAVEHGEDETRLVLVDLAANTARTLAPLAKDAHWLTWARDGSRLLYLAGEDLRLNAGAPDKDLLVLGGVSAPSAAPFAFSPDSQTVAILAGSDILLAPVSDMPSLEKAHRTQMPVGCGLVDLQWSPTGNSLLVLCYPAPGTHDYQLVHIDRNTGDRQTIPAKAVRRLLGWRPSGQLVVVREHDAFEQAAILSPAGTLQPWGADLEPPEVFVLGYAPSPDLVLLAGASEDQGDPVVLHLAPFGSGALQSWLKRYPRLSDLRFSPSGDWAAFADRAPYNAGGQEGGDLYVVRTGSEDTHLAVRGTPGSVSYSAPALLP